VCVCVNHGFIVKLHLMIMCIWEGSLPITSYDLGEIE